MNLQDLNNQLRNGICPKELNDNLQTACIDFSKLQYNSRYQSVEFYSAKFPKGWGDSPLFIPIIEGIADKAKLNNVTPLNQLNKISSTNIVNDPDTFEQ